MQGDRTTASATHPTPSCPEEQGADGRAPLSCRSFMDRCASRPEGGFAANRIALALFLLQLGLNALWSWLFFTWRLGGIAFAEMLVLWAFILAALIAFWKVRTLAGALLVPYLLWVTFAAMLNYTLWQQNPQVL